VKSNGLQNQSSYATIPPKGVVAMRKEYYQGEVSVRAMKKYREKEGIKTVRFDVRAGSKEALEEEAKSRGLSVAQLIVDSVNAYVGRVIISNRKQ
jgi:hypothetical protein